MTDWLSIAEAAAISGLSEEAIRGAIVLGRLRAEPTGNLADYRLRRDDLVRFAGEEGVSMPEPPRRRCCGVLRPALALAVIAGGLLFAYGVSMVRPACCTLRPPAEPSIVHAEFDRLTGQWPDDLDALEDEQRALLIGEWEMFLASLETEDAAGRDLMRHVAERNLEALNAPRR